MYHTCFRLLTWSALVAGVGLPERFAFSAEEVRQSPAGVIDVAPFGAKPDGATLSTQAIQKAVDQCAARGGGTVRLGEGTWLSGTIVLKSNVTLLLERGCTLLGSPNLADYVEQESLVAGHPGTKQKVACALIVGLDVEKVAVRGQGTIDGNGAHFRDKTKRRPKCLMLVGCRDVLVEGVRMVAAGSWMQHYRNCDRLTVRGITVFNHVSFNNDGLDIDGCRDVTIADCTIDSDDDALVLKSLSERPCENVTIRNCSLRSHCNALKMGTESGGGFKNITAQKCTICSPRDSKVTYGRQRGLAGIALEIVDGGQMDNVRVSDVTIEGVTAPIFLRLGNRGRKYASQTPGIGTLRNVRLSRIAARKCSPVGCAIAGLPDHPIEDVLIEDVCLEFEGGESREATGRKIPERPDAYPESTMFGTLPAYGFYCRHVKGLTLRNVSLATAEPDGRHALFLDDAQEVLLDRFVAKAWPDAAPLLRLTESREITIRNSAFQVPGGTLLRVEGPGSRRIVLEGNDLGKVARLLDVAADVPPDAVVQRANRP